jgi:hypothetical protein
MQAISHSVVPTICGTPSTHAVTFVCGTRVFGAYLGALYVVYTLAQA